MRNKAITCYEHMSLVDKPNQVETMTLRKCYIDQAMQLTALVHVTILCTLLYTPNRRPIGGPISNLGGLI